MNAGPFCVPNLARVGVALAVATSVLACTSESPESSPDPEPSEGVAAALPVATLLTDAIHGDSMGMDLVQTVCTACHSLTPPPTLAPPLPMVVAHYLETFGTPTEAGEALDAWLAEPNASHSIMPDQAIERFGVMPPLPLDPEQRAAVVAYLLEEFSDTTEHMGRGRMDGRRMRGRPPGGG